jgi:hypothetical protein
MTKPVKQKHHRSMLLLQRELRILALTEKLILTILLTAEHSILIVKPCLIARCLMPAAPTLSAAAFTIWVKELDTAVAIERDFTYV